GLVPVDVVLLVTPLRHEIGRQNAVGGLGQRGVLVLAVSVELGTGGLGDRQILDTGDHVGRALVTLTVHVHHSGAHTTPRTHERVVVSGAVDLDAVPGVLPDLDPGTLDSRV